MCILILMKLHIFTRSFFLSQFQFLMNIPRKRRCINKKKHPIVRFYFQTGFTKLVAKKGLKMHFFSHFLSSRHTACLPYRLSHIDALCINLFYWSKDQSLEVFMKKYWELGELKISVFFESAILNFLKHL